MGTFKRGVILELKVNANSIPAGRYRFLGQEDGFLLFAVNRKILFGLSAEYYATFLTPSRRRKTLRTSPLEFLDQYYRLCETMINQPFDRQKLTFCAVDPSVMSEAA